MMLEHAGFKNVTSTDLGAEAIDLAKLYGPKFYIVILDLGLPDIHGFEVYKRLGEFHPAPLAVVFLTGDDSEESREKAYRMVSGNIVEMVYMTKPFHRNHLTNRISLLMTSIHDRREKLVMLTSLQDTRAIDKIQKDLEQLRIIASKDSKMEFVRSLGHDVLKGAVIGVFAILTYYGLSSVPFESIRDFFQN